MQQTIALLTDFGTADTYVGVMKGVIRGIAPEAALVDLTHAVEPQNIKQGAFLLLNSYRYFPAGTVFLVVVDPGVGSTRKPIAVRAGDYTFVAPNNGVLSYILRELGNDVNAVELSSPEYRLNGLSNTFHGRDLFAPAAAHLAAGVALEAFGKVVEKPIMLREPVLRATDGRLQGEVVHIDHFGSAVTSIGQLRWVKDSRLSLTPRFGSVPELSFKTEDTMVLYDDRILTGIHRTYGEVGQGEVLALVGSSGFLELAINGGSYAAAFDVNVGDRVQLQFEQTGQN